MEVDGLTDNIVDQTIINNSEKTLVIKLTLIQTYKAWPYPPPKIDF